MVTTLPTILVADDDVNVRRIIVRRLQSLAPRCHILEAGDGLTAVTLLKNHQIDGVITDFMMPGATGLDILATARQLGRIPVVFISAHQSLAATALQRGAAQFVDKPFSLDQLDQALRLLVS